MSNENRARGSRPTASRRRLGAAALASGLLVALAGCSRDEAVRADLEALDTFTEQLVQKVESAEDPATGVKAGAEFLAADRAEIAERMSRIHAVRGFQVNDETKQILTRSITANVTGVNTLKLGMLRATMGDAQLSAALDALVDDYNALVKGE